jgi:hypothetical protein
MQQAPRQQSLAWKPDFAQTIQRFAAWWQGEVVDRPPVTVTVTPSRPYAGPVSQHTTQTERWLDVTFIVEAAIAEMARTDYVGDAFPIFWPNIGPEISATPFGVDLDFTETTSWSKPIIGSGEEWRRVATAAPDFGNRYWQTVEAMTDYAIELCQGRYVVGISDLHGNYDILAALRDPMQLCLDLVDCPDAVAAAGRNVATAFAVGFERLYAKVAAAGFGSTTWTPLYHEGRAYVPSSDFWCMVSPRVAEEWILPDILTEMAPLERSIFHLDGPQALRHLDLLLDLPQLNAVQWVYGAGRGPAARWIDVYRRIRAAGKSIELIAQSAGDALAVLDAIGPAGVWVRVEPPFATVEEANAFVKAVARCRAA